jgi:hypothetical protein
LLLCLLSLRESFPWLPCRDESPDDLSPAI